MPRCNEDARGPFLGTILSRSSLPLLLAASLLAAACVSPPVEPPDAYSLNTRLTDDGILLEWTDPGSSTAGFDVEVLPTDGTWESLGTAPGASFEDTEIPVRTTHLYRVRSRAHDGLPPGQWSAIRAGTYVEPVLPVVRVDTDNAQPVTSKEEYLHGHVDIDPNGSGYDAFSAPTRIKGRGNSTWGMAKKPYKLKLDSKASVFGMPSEKDWVLLANHADRSQLRTWTAQAIGHMTDLAWTPDSVHVEVVLNGRYLGVYQLTQQVEIKENRLDITEMQPGDTSGEALTGGYLLEVDERLEENHEIGFRTRRHLPIVIKDPEPAGQAQYNYIRGYIQAFEDALFSSGASDPLTGYRAYLDVDSYIDWYITEELLKNQDANFSSAYLYKDRSEKLHFGPLWDFDLSMGTDAGMVPNDPEQWWVNQPHKPFPNRFFEDPTFVDRLLERWDTYKDQIDALPAQLIEIGNGLEPAIRNDGARWNYSTPGAKDTPQFLADWLTIRTAWFDTQLRNLAAR